ncbi:iron-containing alcohol dehydrogenase family protein [Cetobacterium somerae]|uniref:iron-containing alcohol dehydrogenase family protein n=1 Tax=Cetobacterium somerae TaxID=188913 RepID=UPI00225C2F06|nr:iron-containing alcohol dehydrogenase family protein [Cetobacterium somerae]MCX3067610.1 iron-containing alcohol dehydrogenase family protein [Cetobacterium somerae]
MEKSILTEVYMDSNIWNILGKEIQNYNNILVIHGDKSLLSIKNEFFKTLKDKNFHLVHYGNECCHSIVNSTLDNLNDNTYDLILGIGGGKSIDASKVMMDKLNIPLFTIPTIASTCAAVSYISVMYEENHVFQELYFLKRPPHKTFINLDTLIAAPKKYLWAGIGDTLAKYYEMNLKARGKRLNFNTTMGEKLSHLCKETMLNYGKHALSTSIVDVDFKEVAGVILVTTGIVSNLIDFKYNGALAHAIFDALTKIKRVEEEHLHGEVVAFGILIQLQLEGNHEELNNLLNFYKEINLPTTLKEIVVKNEYLEKKEEIIDKILNSITGSEIPLNFTRDEFITILEGNL